MLASGCGLQLIRLDHAIGWIVPLYYKFISFDAFSSYNFKYQKCLPWDNEMTSRSEQTVRRCISYIMDFLVLFIEDRQGHCKIRNHDLYRSVDGWDKHGKFIKRRSKSGRVFPSLSKGDDWNKVPKSTISSKNFCNYSEHPLNFE